MNEEGAKAAHRVYCDAAPKRGLDLGDVKGDLWGGVLAKLVLLRVYEQVSDRINKKLLSVQHRSSQDRSIHGTVQFAVCSLRSTLRERVKVVHPGDVHLRAQFFV
jgi:hypothetical protein